MPGLVIDLDDVPLAQKEYSYMNYGSIEQAVDGV